MPRVKKPTLKRAVKWFEFVSPDDDVWSVFLSTRKTSKCLQGDKEEGPCFGICIFTSRRIYLEAEQTMTDLRDVLLHEILHLCLHRVPLPECWNEQLVREVTPRLLHIMTALKFRFPPVPPEVLPLIKLEVAA